MPKATFKTISISPVPRGRPRPTCARISLAPFSGGRFIFPKSITGVNYRFAGTNTINDNQYFARGDHTFSVNDKIFFRYATNIPFLFQISNNPQFSYRVVARNHNYAGSWLHIFTPTIINEFRAGYVASRDDTFNPRANTDFNVSQLGIKGFNVINDNNRPFTTRETGIPTMSISGSYSL